MTYHIYILSNILGISTISYHLLLNYHKINSQKTATRLTKRVSDDFYMYSIEWIPDKIMVYTDKKIDGITFHWYTGEHFDALTISHKPLPSGLFLMFNLYKSTKNYPPLFFKKRKYLV